MYINNPRKLFNDLYNIPTMSSYMEAVDEDGDAENLEDLISIVEYNIELATSGDSMRWEKMETRTDIVSFLKNSKELAERVRYNQQLDDDYKRLKQILRIIRKEQSAKYTMTCPKCGHVWFYSKKPKYENGYKCKCGGDIEIKKLENK